ncbi:hypothetical protein DNI29_21795 [Hymenobacter sediminis]|uniref:hypothetical protein n=1 Tax=Hymenobacter sediminis TaxID=2218621 RepID=UPI000F512817|nr:hypothetical protein [Hymenobacter sediminis]RPD44342.1 hypothetical protein DNI29_21795 [Hymenobacter sediminis]
MTGRTVRLKAFPTGRTNGEVPLFTLYLYPTSQADSLLVGEDTEPSLLELDQAPRLQIPLSAVLLFQTYHAGAGSQYYVRADQGPVRVYRRRLEEATPDNEARTRPAWQMVAQLDE